ncbi:bifunctional protein-serine/threonine kinase/phosphatase [Geomesophilobacter sediminis]|uniref:non-specific serine/threonine protein kinase n=1 Tax=Geomesophilobacter sediminis TaxID=2798584 RepID=A0A8J7JFK1_9BACT|nr:bifunctional protein-serine/threonine kinase/phosphatase [Geomesophilobacter sediminis]MBJ6725109.1 bifunctional protein-serine/threonine kinase/phosphatase [Geomesophilobacter sediminis]
MEVTYAELSSPGPVRENNEDFVGFWQPQVIEEKRSHGAVAALADGVGGLDRGEVASRLAVETALATFRSETAEKTPQQLLTQMFNAANLAVYDRAMENHGRSPMATTLCLVILRDDEIVVGNVGDSRVYLVRKGEIKQLSTDHSYVGMQQKFGLISEQDAKTSEHRSVLTRSVGQDPMIRLDVEQSTVFKGDRVVLCSDGLYAHVADAEIAEIVMRLSPAQACRQLVALAEQHGTDDNLSVQVLQINEVEKKSYYRGLPVYHEPPPAPKGYEIQPGQTLDERFFITETISRSGMATIFKATDLLTREDVAVKVPFMEFESDPGFYSRFEREEEIGFLLNHPYILKFVPVEFRSRPYIVTEYLRGYTLAHLLNSVRPLPEKDAVKLAGRICEALAHMHEHGVIHRDLKPQNIMICFDGTIRIMDFGIAKAAEGRRVTFAGFTPAVGTPDYMAPEQVKGKRGDERTDIYSAGAMLYEMVVGVTPFSGESENMFVIMNARVTGDPVAPRKRNPKVSPQLEEVILHAMEREPKHRYDSVATMRHELEHLEAVQLTGRCDRLKAPSPWKNGGRKIMWTAVGAVVVTLVFLLFLFLILQRGPAH